MKSQEAIILSAPLTHADWITEHIHESIPMGPEGVKFMLDHCKAAGWKRIYWRTRDGGRAVYKSAYQDPEGPRDPDSFLTPQAPEDIALVERFRAGMQRSAEDEAESLRRLTACDYANFDSLAAAVEYGHQIGLEIHAWISINEEDHAWGITSRFSKAHPEYRWVRRDGRPYHSQLSFAYPEAADYRLDIVKEIANKYQIDGLFIDWIRTGDVRDDPQNDEDGVADYGYEKPLVSGFKAQYGIDPHDIPNGDPRWVQYRAEPQTAFMRSVKEFMQSTKPELPIAVLVNHPWSHRSGYWVDGNLRGMLLDVRQWAREGLIDSAVPASYYVDKPKGHIAHGGNIEMAYAALKDETEGKVPVWVFAWVPETPLDFYRDYKLAQNLGAPQILFWEADYLTYRSNTEELQKAMSETVGWPEIG